jgi:hypothetical protein
VKEYLMFTLTSSVYLITREEEIGSIIIPGTLNPIPLLITFGTPDILRTPDIFRREVVIFDPSTSPLQRDEVSRGQISCFNDQY